MASSENWDSSMHCAAYAQVTNASKMGSRVEMYFTVPDGRKSYGASYENPGSSFGEQ